MNDHVGIVLIKYRVRMPIFSVATENETQCELWPRLIVRSSTDLHKVSRQGNTDNNESNIKRIRDFFLGASAFSTTVCGQDDFKAY